MRVGDGSQMRSRDVSRSKNSWTGVCRVQPRECEEGCGDLGDPAG